MVAAGAVRDEIRGLFEGLVPAEVIDAYGRLLASDGCAKEQAEAAPSRCPGQFSVTGNGQFPAHLVSVISDRADITALSASLMNTARKDWMSIENLKTEMPLTEDFAEPPLPAFGGRVRCRSIYQASAMDHPVARRIIEACAAAGEQARLLPQVPMKMKLADHTTAMLPLTPTGTSAALLIRAPVIVTALRSYFEMLWDRATPLKPRRSVDRASRLTPAQQLVLRLLAEGHHDKAIAQQAKISVTSVRRHITAIMRKLEVSSRFAAGAAAQRQGWLG